MAAKRVEGVTERLLDAAREEFLAKGYEGASLRAIAERAGSSKGAIYIRYPDKAALFSAVVTPVTDAFFAMMEGSFRTFGEQEPEQQVAGMDSYADAGIERMLDFIYDNFDVFRVLALSGEGTCFRAFMHRLVELDTQTTYRYIEAVGNDAVTSGRLTPEMMHMINTSCFSGIFEVVEHDMSREAAKAYVARLCRFYRAGWETIFYPDDERPSRACPVPDAPELPGAKELVEARGGAP